ncbi:conjugal transfer protein TraF [Psychromonas marina]|uniref:Conjugal transfer protein TraF n=1 Tax=Psychromonas marina TaxID=88364 RepID=A0ABQ6DXY5_9GAMM|nr:conjugal transfer protein TraF [Psychromonas marina]GLS90034.1 conjugal transfer protein TraF [Psychromonas marina]
MNKKTTATLRLLPLCIASILATQANASNHSYDARSQAMGGVGASTSHYLTASFHNPALAARYDESDDVALLIPSIGINASDPTDTIENIEDFSDIYDNFLDAQTIDNAQGVVDQLEVIQGNYAQVQVGTQLAIAIPNKIVSVNLFFQAYADLLVFADIASADLDPNNILNQALSSQALTMGVIVSEFGINLAKSYKLASSEIYYGISPKYQTVNTINYVSSIDNFEFDDWDDDRYQNEQGNMNVDLGLAYQHDAGYGFGLVGKNLIKSTYDTEMISGIQGQYEISPTYTVSANYQNGYIVAAVDLQLNESQGYSKLNGTDNAFDTEADNRQPVAIGVEFLPFNWIKVRAGYQTDLSNNSDDSISAGLGFSAVDVFNIDISARYTDNNSMGAAIQTSFTF